MGAGTQYVCAWIISADLVGFVAEENQGDAIHPFVLLMFIFGLTCRVDWTIAGKGNGKNEGLVSILEPCCTVSLKVVAICF